MDDGAADEDRSVVGRNDAPSWSALTFRLATARDVPQVTSLIKEAYREWREAGLNVSASAQTDAITQVAVVRGRLYVLEGPHGLVGTVTLREGGQESRSYLEITRFAV